MIGTVYQSCYTNATQEVGSVVSSGWRTVAASPDLPPDAGKTCEYLQNLNSTIQTQMLDEKGQVLNLYEISGDERYLYVMRTQYGLVDRVGRPNMFSHAYIFPFDGSQVLDNLNLLLSIDKANFKTSAEEVSAWDGQFIWQSSLTLDGALQTAGMGRTEYAVLVRCVYAQMSQRKSTRPLYIQYDGSEPQLQALLYCIYYGIPLYLRRRLSIASCPAVNDEKKDLVFTCDAKSKGRFFIPQTGQTNILDDRIQRKIDRYGYIDHAARDLPAAEFPAFFHTLEGFAASLGNSSSTSNELVLKVAYQCYHHIDRSDGRAASINFDAFSDEELESCLSDALRSGLHGTRSNMGSQIANMLPIFSRRGLDLSESSEATLDQWIASCDSDNLRRAGLEYRVRKLRALPPEKAADQLLEMPGETFKLYSAELLATPEGEQLLDLYFSKLGSQDLSWEQLQDLWDRSGITASRKRTINAVQTAAWNRYCEDLAPGGDAMRGYQMYAQLMKATICPDLPGSVQYYDCLSGAKEEFWRHRTPEEFRLQDKELYQTMELNGPPICRQFMELIRLAEDFGPGDSGNYLNAVFRFFSSQDALSDEARENAVKELTGHLSTQCGPDYLSWVEAFAGGAKFVGEDSIELLKYMRALYDNTARFDAQTLHWNLESFLVLEQQEAVKAQVCRLVEDACAANDTSEEPVPLDLWLLLGTLQPNCFDIISLRRPKIIGADPVTVVEHSKLIKKPEYQEAAQQYIKKANGKCQEAKTVRYWLNECKQAGKGKRPFSTKRAKDAAPPPPDAPWPAPESPEDGEQGAPEGKSKGKGLRGLFGKK